jgi:ABC-type multidrug transport system fused ATPase/permease subunit
LSQLRALLPYAAKLLPVLTGVAVGETALQQRPDLSALNRRFGEIQSESRGLRSQVETQGEEIERILKQHQERLDGLVSGMESIRREQQEIATASRALARLVKGLGLAIVLLLTAVTVMSALILVHMSHV